MDWISFDSFVEKWTVDCELNSNYLILLLRNPDPEEVEFGVRFSIGKVSDENILFSKIWNNDDLKEYGLNRDYLSNPIIRMSIANALYNANKEVYYKYVKSIFLSKKKEYYSYSIINLADIGTLEDGELFVKRAIDVDDRSDFFMLLEGIEIIDKKYKTHYLARLKEKVKKINWKFNALDGKTGK